MKHTFWFHLLVAGTVLLGLDATSFAFFGLWLFNPTVDSIAFRLFLLFLGWATWFYIYKEVTTGHDRSEARQARSMVSKLERQIEDMKYEAMSDEEKKNYKRYEWGMGMQNMGGGTNQLAGLWPGLGGYLYGDLYNQMQSSNPYINRSE